MAADVAKHGGVLQRGASDCSERIRDRHRISCLDNGMFFRGFFCWHSQHDVHGNGQKDRRPPGIAGWRLASALAFIKNFDCNDGHCVVSLCCIDLGILVFVIGSTTNNFSPLINTGIRPNYSVREAKDDLTDEALRGNQKYASH